MAGSMNRVTLLGHLGKDPEVRSFSNGGAAAPGIGGQDRKVVSFSLATGESWTDRASGEKRERTEWHAVQITNDGLAGVAERYLRKGSKALVEGSLRTRKWQDRDGNDRYTTEVVVDGFGGRLILLGDPGGNRPPPPAQDSWGDRPAQPASPPPAGPAPDDMDDDVPF